jgi:hypothetical protein
MRGMTLNFVRRVAMFTVAKEKPNKEFLSRYEVVIG